MKISREGIRDGVLIAGLACTAAGAGIRWGYDVALLVVGVVLLGAVLGSAVLHHMRGKSEP